MSIPMYDTNYKSWKCDNLLLIFNFAMPSVLASFWCSKRWHTTASCASVLLQPFHFYVSWKYPCNRKSTFSRVQCYDHNFRTILTYFPWNNCQFSWETNVMRIILHEIAVFWVKIVNYFSIFCGKCLKTITPKPGRKPLPMIASKLDSFRW
jgi:hypothetical protein